MDDKDELPPAEAARERRRDRDAEARSRAGMRTGLAKQFKQVLDAQRKRAEEVGPRQKEPATEPEAKPETKPATEPETKRKGRRRAT
jgi:hypothetical protein